MVVICYWEQNTQCDTVKVSCSALVVTYVWWHDMLWWFWMRCKKQRNQQWRRLARNQQRGINELWSFFEFVLYTQVNVWLMTWGIAWMLENCFPLSSLPDCICGQIVSEAAFTWPNQEKTRHSVIQPIIITSSSTFGTLILFGSGTYSIYWIYPPPSNSHHQDCFIFNSGNPYITKPLFATIASSLGVDLKLCNFTTVDGRNPAPPAMYKTLKNNGINCQSLNWWVYRISGTINSTTQQSLQLWVPQVTLGRWQQNPPNPQAVPAIHFFGFPGATAIFVGGRYM